MSATTLATISIVLLEIMVVILVIFFVFYRRYRHLKQQSGSQAAPAEIVVPETKPDHDAILTDYLKSSLQSTSDRRDNKQYSKNDKDGQILKRRVSILNAELNVRSIERTDNTAQAYWDEIVEIYSPLNEEIKELIEQSGNQYKTEIKMLKSEISELTLASCSEVTVEGQPQLQQLTDKLQLYKDMVNSTNDKLAASAKTIDELNGMLEKNSSGDDTSEMQAMINKLKEDNATLKEQLKDVFTNNDDLMVGTQDAARKLEDEEIQMYMGLIKQANEKLKKSTETIDGFKSLLENSDSFDELKQMQDMVDKLNGDNSDLSMQMNSLRTMHESEIQGGGVDISIYKDMVLKVEDKLKESYQTIEDLKALASNSNAEELVQMESMVQMLSQDNDDLRSQLGDVHSDTNEKLDGLRKDSEQQQNKLNDELSMYKGLVNQANDKLKESNATIESLREKITNSESSVEISEMESMLDKLVAENSELEEQLKKVSEQLQVTLDSINLLDNQDNDNEKTIKILKDEKWFLEEQVRHLTEQEKAKHSQLTEKIDELEKLVSQKDSEYEQLLAQQL